MKLDCVGNLGMYLGNLLLLFAGLMVYYAFDTAQVEWKEIGDTSTTEKARLMSDTPQMQLAVALAGLSMVVFALYEPPIEVIERA